MTTGELSFEIESIGGNCQVCSVTGTVRGQLGQADGWKADGKGSACHITFDRVGDAVRVRPTAASEEECRAYCGMRAGFDGVYKQPPLLCTRKSQKANRHDFLRLYRSRNFARANEVLERLLLQCSDFMNWIDIDAIRNNLALSQLHSGDAAKCVSTLSATRAAKSSNEEMLKDDLPPCDFDNYIGVAKATWHNQALCGKSLGAALTSGSHQAGEPPSK